MPRPSNRLSLKWRILRGIKTIIELPITKLCVGLILIGTSSFEVIEDVMNDIPGVKIGAHHGLLMLGLINAISSLPDLVEGIEYAFKGTIEKGVDEEIPIE